MSNSLLTSLSHNAFATGVFSEVSNRTAKYYHFFGKVADWLDVTIPYQVVDSKHYEQSVRDELVVMKEISPADISYIVPRVNWITGTVYSTYDDSYSSEIRGLNLSLGGSGYTSPVVTIGVECPTSTLVSTSSQYFYKPASIGYLYTVTVGGTTGSSNTVLGTTIGTSYTHGTATIKCVGFQATATAELGTLTYADKIVSVAMTYSGYGYLTAPLVTITGGGGAGAIVEAVLVTGKTITDPLVVSYKLEDTKFYAYSPTANAVYVCVDNNGGAVSTIEPSGTDEFPKHYADGYIWKYMCSLDNVNKFLTTDYLPITTASKNKYTPVGSIAGVSIDSAGSGYVGPTSITVSGDGVGAILTPTTTNNAITGVTITNPGSGYTYANLALSSDGLGGSVSAWIFNGIAPNSAQFQSESAVPSGGLVNISVISGGYGYTNATISFEGDGTGAIATATIVAGKITKITMYDSGLGLYHNGSGYTWANVTITGDGHGASARAIIAPYGGLGKDPITQLSAKSLMFYSNISNDKNQGIIQSNEYRQVGIIKNPLRYSDSASLKSNFATACWKIVATTTISNISPDHILTTYSNSILYSYRVIYVSGTSILVTPMDNGVPTKKMQFTRQGTNFSFIASEVTPPSVDKYSGDILIVDNEVAFTPSSAVVRTIVNF